MKKFHSTFGALLLAAGGCGDEVIDGTSRSEIPPTVRLECAAPSGTPSAADWSCPESVRVDCSAPETNVLRVVSPSDELCDADSLSVTFDGPLTLGTHRASVRDEQDVILCSSDVVVRRGADLKLVPRQVSLWPPNHKLHQIDVEDCVEIVGACPGEALDARFIWASSDEPEDALGDGHHAPDITLSADCQQLSVRSERQGPSNGRVYTLGVRVSDAAGETYETSCDVSVDHDQSGVAAVAGPAAYRWNFDGSTPGLPSCEGSEPTIF